MQLTKEEEIDIILEWYQAWHDLAQIQIETAIHNSLKKFLIGMPLDSKKSVILFQYFY